MSFKLIKPQVASASIQIHLSVDALVGTVPSRLAVLPAQPAKLHDPFPAAAHIEQGGHAGTMITDTASRRKAGYDRHHQRDG
ncbi:hypothetical protein [Bradyrhizobium japonicum]|uniref:hypothetical protein n=1 Tax=Bradyrhizobium japonicum TaxID=375 RepID=UPI00200CF1A0|nr:hypothetical protein [Bradyrhizobium japonicum]UQE03619.1 hypothetical protein JEY30_47690 [Bradyrhizobium japonicum]